jgi:hypothetical protein
MTPAAKQSMLHRYATDGRLETPMAEPMTPAKEIATIHGCSP